MGRKLTTMTPPSCIGTMGGRQRGSGASVRDILLFHSLAMGKG